MVGSHFTAGLRKHPLAGFSRSVYHTLTGQKVPVILTHLSDRYQTTPVQNKLMQYKIAPKCFDFGNQKR